jgi:type IV secretory pathway protease TraF
MRIPALPTLVIGATAGIVLPLAALLAVARAEHWSLNVTTCMPIGFYRRGPVPTHLQDGDMVYFCPPVREHLPLSFSGPTAMLKSGPPGDNPAMHEAISGLWLDFAPHGKWACADHLMPFAKIVAATAGQTVEITRAGVVANGHLLPNSRVVTRVNGIPVVHLALGTKLTIPEGYFWDYAPGTFAYTSAYYGPVPTRNILGSLRPALVIPGSQPALGLSKPARQAPTGEPSGVKPGTDT